MTNAEQLDPDFHAEATHAELAQLRDEVARLEASARMNEQRMALVVHELRQPLNLLVMNAARLARRASGDEQRVLDALRTGGFRLDVMISDLSDASFLESGCFALEYERINIARLVMTQTALHAPGVVVSVDGDIPVLQADPRRVAQVLTNLLVNAKKHGRPQSRPHVAVAHRGAFVVIEVVSEGGGIALGERTKVFEPYYRGRDRRPGAGGLGLGLYICKMLVEAHGGRIWTDGDADRTSFGFCIPILGAAPRISETRIIAPKEAPRADARTLSGGGS